MLLCSDPGEEEAETARKIVVAFAAAEKEVSSVHYVLSDDAHVIYSIHFNLPRHARANWGQSTHRMMPCHVNVCAILCQGNASIAMDDG